MNTDMTKLIYPGLSGVVVGIGAVIDQHASIPLFTGVGVTLSLIGLTFSVTRKGQQLLDRFEHMETRITSLEGALSERAEDMEHLRDQLKKGSLMEPLAGESGLRILLVEDNRNDRDLLRRKLGPSFMLDEATTLNEANRQMSKSKYDCVLLDLGLPDSHFKRTVATFVNHNPEALVIALTGSMDRKATDSALAQGADAVWIKGQDDIDLRTMVERLRRAIYERRRRQ